MDKSVFVSGIKTYQGKNRFSTYRPSSLMFKNDDLFDQLIKEEERKQPLQETKKNLNDKPFRNTKSYQPNVSAPKVHHSNKRSLATLKPMYDVKGIDHGTFTNKIHSAVKQKKKHSVIKRGKENTRCNSRLYASDDSNDELPSLSVYDLSFVKKPLDLYTKKRKPLRRVKTKLKSRPQPSAASENVGDTNKENLSPNHTKDFQSTRDCSAEDSDDVKIDKFQNPQKLQDTVLKKPTTFVERSSDLFYKNSVRNNYVSIKTRKKLPFLDENYSDRNDHSDVLECENQQCSEISGINRNNEHVLVSRLFDFHDETKNNVQYLNCTVPDNQEIFKPVMASTPNFGKIRSLKCLENHAFSSETNESVTKESVQAKSPVPCSDSVSYEISHHSILGNLETNSTPNKSDRQSCNLFVAKKDSSIKTSSVMKEKLANLQNSHLSECSRISNITNGPVKVDRSLKNEIEGNNRESLLSNELNVLDLKSIFESPVGIGIDEKFSHNFPLNSNFTDYRTCPCSDSELETSSKKSNNDEVETEISDQSFETNNLANSLRSLELSNENSHEATDDSQVFANSREKTEYHRQQENSSSSNDSSCVSSRSFSSVCSSSANNSSCIRSENFSSVRSSFVISYFTSSSESFEHSSKDEGNDGAFSTKNESYECEVKATNSRTESEISNESQSMDDEITAMMKLNEENTDALLSPEHSNSNEENIAEAELQKFESSLTNESSRNVQSNEIERTFAALSISPKENLETEKENCIDQASFENIEKYLSPIRNRSFTFDDFMGWLKADSDKVLELKKAYEEVIEKLTTRDSPKPTTSLADPEDSFCTVNDFSSRLKFVTARRKKNYALPTLNEEEIEENGYTEAVGSTTNSLLPVQPSMCQPSFCNSQFFEKSSVMRHSIILNGGKKWRRSFITLKNIKDFGLQLENVNEDGKGRNWKKNVQNLISSQPFECSIMQEIEECSTVKIGCSNTFVSSVCNSTNVISEKCNRPDKARFSLCVNTRQADDSGGSVTSSDNSKLFNDKSFVSFVDHSRESRIGNFELEAGDYSRTCNLSLERYDIQDHFFAKEVVLRHCKQSEPLPFDECFNDRELLNCKKIGEGVYGEVFMLKRSRKHCSVLKIIPIEGELLINGERQKKFEEIVTELIITSKLSDLRRRKDFYTDSFAELQRCRCVYGKYPQRLIDLWNEYDISKGSDNDSPKIFKNDQLYIVLELSHGGEDLESFVFNNAQQALSVFTQVTNALAVAEEAFMFEHRDLHWGNVLISKCKTKETQFIIHDRKNIVKLHGVKVTIIDYTLSRISVDNRVVYNDIGQDPDLFTAEGDFQFEIYRLMRDVVRNVWDRYVPKTNVFWLRYLLDKMMKEVRYRRSDTKIHQSNLELIENFYTSIVNFDSSYQLCCNAFFR